MMGVAVVTMPEGMVKGPERILPKNSVFKVADSRVEWMTVSEAEQLYWFGPP
jgi:hypothetical protein